MSRTVGPRTWAMFAGQRTQHGSTELEYTFFYPHPGLVRMGGFDEVHEVTLVEDADGELLGWIDADSPDGICMIEHHKIFGVQFHYGVQVEIDRDYGEVVPLRADPRSASTTFPHTDQA